MRFSQRLGLTEVRSVVQIESIDDPLRNKLWSLLYVLLDRNSAIEYSNRRDLYHQVYLNFLHAPIDRIPDYSYTANDELRGYFYSDEWHKPYDLLEFVLQHLPYSEKEKAYGVVNRILEDYLSAYRFVGETLVPVTDETHVQSIEAALQTPLSGVRTHLSKSLSLLGNRQNPDAENAIKEAIQAVESLCASIVGKRTTLGDALKKLESAGVTIHPALKEAWLKQYGYTSDADGIRHALQLQSNASMDDALYFLISCSAFIGLLAAKATAASVPLRSVET